MRVAHPVWIRPKHSYMYKRLLPWIWPINPLDTFACTLISQPSVQPHITRPPTRFRQPRVFAAQSWPRPHSHRTRKQIWPLDVACYLGEHSFWWQRIPLFWSSLRGASRPVWTGPEGLCDACLHRTRKRICTQICVQTLWCFLRAVWTLALTTMCSIFCCTCCEVLRVLCELEPWFGLRWKTIGDKHDSGKHPLNWSFWNRYNWTQLQSVLSTQCKTTYKIQTIDSKESAETDYQS